MACSSCCSSCSVATRSRAPERTYSRSVRSRSSGGRWSCSATRVPFWNASSPPCFSVSPERMRSNVVLPAPFGPESATRSRRSTLNETPSNRTLPAISLRRFEAMTTAIALGYGAMATVLAIDVGSSSVRAQRFDETGEPVDELKQERYGGTDPAEIVRLTRQVVAGREADATGTSCFGHSLLPLDAAGKPLTPLLGWRDTRSASAADWL